MMTLIYCPKLDCTHNKEICTSKDFGVCVKDELVLLRHNVGGYACCGDHEKSNTAGGDSFDNQRV